MRKHTLALRLGLLSALALVMVFFAVGCSSNGTTTAHTPLNATLSGTQEVPPITDITATGTATVLVNQEPDVLGIRGRRTIDVALRTQGLSLSTVTAVFIQVGRPGTTGAPIFTLFEAGPGMIFSDSLTRRLTVNDFVPPPGGMSFDEAVNALLNGQTYVNIITAAHRNGEIRGQLGPVALQATLSGQSAIPPVNTAATGSAVFQINNAETSILTQLGTQGLSNDVTAVTIRFSNGSDNGPVLFTLYSNPQGGSLPTLFSGTLTSSNFVIPPPSTGITNFTGAVNAMISGRTYIVVETTTNPTGIIRGPIFTRP